MPDEIITQEYLRELFSYNGEQLIWKVSRGKVAKGYTAGCLDAEGYRVIRINGKNYKAHRLIWLYVYGDWPRNQIDHANGQRDDNRVDNLCDASHSENMRNSKKQNNNKSGINGVCWHKGMEKWRCDIWIDKKKKHLGFFDCKYHAASIRHLAQEIEGGYTRRHGQ